MKNYKVMLTRNYIVDISADNKEEAKFLSDFLFQVLKMILVNRIRMN